MKSTSKILLGSALLVGALMAQQASAAAVAITPVSGKILNSKHDLSASSSAGTKATVLDEVCVFCHTPHGGDYQKGALWNRVGTLATATNVYAGSAMDGEVLAAFATSSASCMTCHDGATALDNLINAPGSGGYNAAGASADTPAMAALGAGVTAITGDLRNDHPIGVPYCGGVSGGACLDSAFVLATNSGDTVSQLYKEGVGAGVLAAVVATGLTDGKYFIDTDANGTRTKQDLMLYIRNDFTKVGYTVQPSVECSTCHDPHNGSATSPFLRITNTRSALCFSCHIK